MFEIRVVVAIAASDGHVVLEGDELPGAGLWPEESPFDVAHDILRGATGIDGKHWLSVRQVCLMDDPGYNKVLLYAVELPERVALKGGHRWEYLLDVGGETLRLVTVAYNHRNS